jgi:hypothetical protein
MRSSPRACVSSFVHKAEISQSEQGESLWRKFQRIFNENSINCRRPIRRSVENWVAAVRQEEALASGNHNVAELDKWEAAHFREHKLHKEADYRKRLYEDALRREFYGF